MVCEIAGSLGEKNQLSKAIQNGSEALWGKGYSMALPMLQTFIFRFSPLPWAIFIGKTASQCC